MSTPGKSMAYDNAAYQAVLVAGGRLNGNGGKVAFAAYTTMLLKSVQINLVTAGTAADAKTLTIIRQGTATTTTALKTDTAALGGFNTALATTTLSAGDSVALTKGADATEDGQVTFELVLTPGANVTA